MSFAAVIRRFIDAIAQGRRAERPREEDVPPYPSKANHWLRYLRRTFGWGVEYGHCTTNPARGVRTVREKADHRMPEREVFRAVQRFAAERGALGPREKGALPAYLAPAMEIAYKARLRKIEVLTLTDANDLGDALLTNRRKGSRDNQVRKDAALTAGIDALRRNRERVWARRRYPIPMRPEARPLVVGEDGHALTVSGFNTAWQKMMRQAIEAGVLPAEQRFGMHGLKHRGVTDTSGDKKRASGHVTDAMVHLYDHELPKVEPAGDNCS